MASEPKPQSPSLFSMARSKLQSAVASGVRDSCSLHRWVLLKNSIIRSHPSDDTTVASDKADVTYVYRRDEEGREEDEEEDAFMFPDPDALLNPPDRGVGDSENQWLDSLLETLGVSDETEEADGGVSVSILPVDEDDEPLSPLYSPSSSSDDLVDPSSLYCNPHAIPTPYPIPYPPVAPAWFESSTDSLLDASPPLYHDPLPYYDVDDTEDLPVPDAIEDTSDDESDAPSTPFDHSTASLAPLDPVSIPLPPRRRRRSQTLQPQVYIDTDDCYFYPFELDPDDDPTNTARAYRPPIYQEC
ncbi:hypothetical protein AcW1_005612 [Taiwanofungus camphoratus]|nr:hypothetical protein AcW1_005612 [Antrodia cinnamomea]